jgi:Family of unknown function (DUF6527)
MKRDTIDYKFVEYIPKELDEGIVYISTEFAVTAHLCCCGCGLEVSLPLSPADWQLAFDGRSISLSPSVGRGSSPCRSHYLIQRNQVIWATKLSPSAYKANRLRDDAKRAVTFETEPEAAISTPTTETQGFWSRVKRLFSR